MAQAQENEKIGSLEATAIGVGGMVGGGIFAVLGLAVQQTRGGAPVAFALAGVVAMVTAYSYSHLSVTHPSRGGRWPCWPAGSAPEVRSGCWNWGVPSPRER